jgi:hypothetical protein
VVARPDEGSGQSQPSTGGAPAGRDPEAVVELGSLAGARSGDKGGNANIGFWVKQPETYPWLRETVTVAWVQANLPGADGLPVDVYPFPNLNAVNVVVHGYLGRGVAENTNLDPQAKGIGELLRARLVPAPSRS